MTDYSAGPERLLANPLCVSVGRDAQQKPPASGGEKAAQQGEFYTLTYKYKCSGHVVQGLIPAHYHGLEVKEGTCLGLLYTFPTWLDLHFYSSLHNNLQT